MTTAEKTDPALWDRVKQEITDSDKVGEPGQWSARKAQMAVQEYKRRGGGYAADGPDQGETDLNDWTEEDWGTKSGGDSGETGERYLPRTVRMMLTEAEYARSTKQKRAGDAQFVPQPGDVRDKAARIRKEGPSKADAEARARDLDISERSVMTKDELVNAIEEATDDEGRDPSGEPALEAMSKSALYDRAKDCGIKGRSKMSKQELVEALAAG